jgi:hypothetical protein
MNAYLFPEKSRAELELEYQAVLSALCLAAEEKVGGDIEARKKQVGDWLVRSAERAARMAATRQEQSLEAFEGTVQ